MPQFQHIEYLLLLALVPLAIALFFFALYKKKAVIKKIGDKDLVKMLTANYSASGYLKKFLLIVVAFGIMILGMANLRSPIGSQKVNRNGIDVMIALDVSKSMLAQDVRPTRLDKAKQLLSRLTDKLSNDRIGIVVFAGKAYLQMPLTGDHSAAKMYLNAATTETVPTQGTVIGDALKMCYASFNSNEKKYKAVVLISDGEDHDEGAANTATEMAQEGIVIYTIGIGSPQGSPLMDEATNQLKTDKDGNTVISKLNEDALRSIAEKGNGKYMLYQSTDAVVGALTQELSGMDQRAVTDDSLMNYKSYFGYFLAFALLLLLIEMFISERRTIKRMQQKAKPVLTVLFVSLGLFASAQQEEKKMIKEGNVAYNNNDYIKAETNYNTVVKKNPNNATAQFNHGNALYRTEKKQEAISAYDNAAGKLNTPVEKSNALYNKGVVYHNDKKLPECIDAYKKALILDPTNEDARQNLQKALQQQKQQENKDQDKNKDKKQDDNKDKKEPKPKPSKLNKQDAAEKLKALQEQERNLQDKLHKVNAASVTKPEKDW